MLKPVSFLGNSLAVVRDFPSGARREAGFQIERLQRGLDPDHWKPMPSIGPGIREIRVTDSVGAFRVIYTTVVGDAVYVLHAFQKKSQSTPRRDLVLAAARFAQLKRSRP